MWDWGRRTCFPGFGRSSAGGAEAEPLGGGAECDRERASSRSEPRGARSSSGQVRGRRAVEEYPAASGAVGSPRGRFRASGERAGRPGTGFDGAGFTGAASAAAASVLLFLLRSSAPEFHSGIGSAWAGARAWGNPRSG